MPTWPFPFLRHGVGVSNTYSLWAVAAEPTTAIDSQPLDALSPGLLSTSVAGPVIEVRASQFKKLLGRQGAEAPAAHARIDAALRKMHAKTPLALVVRDNRVEPSAWHQDTLGAPVQMFDALERLITAPGPYLKAPFQMTSRVSRSIPESMLSSLREHLLASMIRATCRLLVESASGKKARAVLEDQLSERLPSWLGRDFTVDLVLRERLALTLAISPVMVQMPPKFYEEEARILSENHAKEHKSRAVALAHSQRKGTSVDWRKPALVKAAIAAGELRTARDGFLDTDALHVKTLLALTHKERLKLVTQYDFATLAANAAIHLALAGRFSDALSLYDAAIEGPLDPMAAANPLYAIQDDNNHLGVDPTRSRRYLERCLPHGPQNPTIFLNGAFVAMELDEVDQAIELLTQAKAARLPIKQFKNERLFVPLRGRADFKALMR